MFFFSFIYLYLCCNSIFTAYLIHFVFFFIYFLHSLYSFIVHLCHRWQDSWNLGNPYWLLTFLIMSPDRMIGGKWFQVRPSVCLLRCIRYIRKVCACNSWYIHGSYRSKYISLAKNFQITLTVSTFWPWLGHPGWIIREHGLTVI